MSLWGVTSLTATVGPSSNYYQSFPGGQAGIKMITVRESEARRLTVGNYVEHDGRIWKVARRTPSSDWFKDEIYIRLEGAHYDPLQEGLFSRLLGKIRPVTRENISWLEDQAFPRLA